MADLINCKQVASQSVGGLTTASNDINTIELFIEPDNSQGYTYTVDVRDFEDKTYLLPAEDIDGIATGYATVDTAVGSQGAGGLGISLTNTTVAGALDNKIKVTVDIDNDYMISADRTIKVDIGGTARLYQYKEVVLALRTDFENQIRGGNIPIFDPTTNSTTNTDFAGKEGVGRVTFTPATGTTQLAVNTTAVPSAAAPNTGNDYTKKDDIIYVKAGVEIGQWHKIGTIVVDINTTTENSAIAANQIPSASQGKYGFVHRNPYEGLNNYNEPSAIGKDFNFLANSVHQLRAKDDEEFEVPHAQQDGITTGSIDIFTYKFSPFPDAQFNNVSDSVKNSAPGRPFLTRSWQREWWFKYPAPAAIYSGIDPTDYVFNHTTDEITAVNFNNDNDLGLTGFLIAGPASSNTLKISNIEFEFSTWTAMNLENANLESISEPDGEDDYAYVIPLAGNNNQVVGTQQIVISGDTGAKFRLEMEKVSVEDFTTGRSLGSDTDSTFRNLLEFDDIIAETGDGGELGITQVVEIDSTQQVKISMPTISANTGSNINNYYIRVIAESDTEILQGAHDSKFGADVDSADYTEDFKKGLNWYGGPGNTFSIRARQNPSVNIDLQIDIDDYAANGESVSIVTGGTYSDTGVQLYDFYPQLPQQIPFVFTIKGTGGHFEFNDGCYISDSSNSKNTNAENDAAWGTSYQCSNQAEEDFTCALSDVYSTDFYRPGEGVRLYKHNFPVQNQQGLNILNGAEHACVVNGWIDWWSGGYWQMDAGFTVTPIGSQSKVRIQRSTAGGQWAYFQQTFPTAIGTEYEVSAELLTLSGSVGARLFIVQTDGAGNEVQTHTLDNSSSAGTLGGTFTAAHPYAKIKLIMRDSDTIGDFIEWGCVKVFKPGGFEDHGASTNGNELVGISNLLAIKGNITSGVSSSWAGDPTDLTVDSGSDFDDYLSVVGILNVSSWGDVSNEYRLNMRHIAKWV